MRQEIPDLRVLLTTGFDWDKNKTDNVVPLRSIKNPLPAEATSKVTEKPGQRRAAVFGAESTS